MVGACAASSRHAPESTSGQARLVLYSAVTHNAHFHVPIAVGQADVHDVLLKTHTYRFVGSKIGRQIMNRGLVESDINVAIQTDADVVTVVSRLQRGIA